MRLVLCAGLLLTGCSLIVSIPDECSSDADCDAVGPGLVCDVEAALCVQKGCTNSIDCDALGPNLVCDPDEGLCVERGCTTNEECAEYGSRFACIEGQCTNACQPARFSSSEEQAVKLAAVLPLTTQDGEENAAVRVRRWSIELALKEINDGRGGIQVGNRPARKLNMLLCDSRFDEGLTERLTHHLVADKRVAILTAGTSETQRVLTVARPSGSLVMSVSATADKLTVSSSGPVDNAGLFWRTAPRDEGQSDVLVEAMKNGDLFPRLGIVFENNDYGLGIADGVTKRWEGELVRVAFDPENPATAPLVELGTPPSRLLVVARPANAAAIVRALKEGGYASSASITLSDAATNQTLVEELGDDASMLLGVAGAMVWTDTTSPAFTAYRTAYELFRRSDEGGGDFEDFRQEGTYGPNTYDAMYALAYGVAAALPVTSTLSGTSISQGLGKLAGGVAVKVGSSDFPQGLQAISAGTGLTLTGASGPLLFDGNGDVAGTYAVCTFKGDPVRFDLQNCTPVE